MKWIEEKKVITPKIGRNWKIIPEDWWQKGKDKDYELLFGQKSFPEIDHTKDTGQ
jgi:2',3'-cyclic-nucleotide 2'-phosphodiesterase/3'-nucleotidase